MNLRVFAVSLLLAFANVHAALPAGVSQVATVEGISEYRLGNGLRVVLFPDAGAASTSVNVTYLVGSRHEKYGETGMAHLLEHMLFKGTQARENVWAEMTKRGMRNNGSTWYDRTNYFETFNASPPDLEWAISMEADRMVNSRVDRKDLDTEMTVVRNEMERGENNPSRVLFQRLVGSSYRWHNYGKETIGARSDVEGVDIESLRAFYRTYYQPDNAVVVIAGAFDPDQTLAWIAKYFGAIPKPARTLPRLYTVEPVQDGERIVTIRRVGDEQRLGVAYHGVPGAHPDYVAITALAEIMSIAPAGRLYKSLVETKKASAVDSWAAELLDPGFVIFDAKVPLTGLHRRAREPAIANARRRGQAADHAGRARPRAAHGTLKHIDEALSDPTRFGIRPVGVDRSRRLAPLLPASAIAGAPVKACGRAAASRLQYLKPANRSVAQFIPDAKPDRAPVVRGGRRRRAGEGLQGRSGGQRRASCSWPTPRTSRRARSASRSPTA
jgi:zinc protease